MTIKVAVIALDGCYGSSLHGLVDVLVVANAHHNKELGVENNLFSWQFLSSLEQKITMSNGLMMDHERAEDCEVAFDVVFIPAVLYDNAKLFCQKLAKHKALYQWLNKQHQAGAIICANCTATFIMAESGLLADKECTTVWWLEHLFKKRFRNISLKFNELIIEQERLITAGAATSHFQLGLCLLKKFTSQNIVEQTAKTMLIDTRKVHVSPEQMLNLSREHNNKLVLLAQDWINQHLEQSINLSELASQLGTSERTLTRQFKETLATTPIKYVQSLRINTAKYLLESSTLNLDRIIEKVGYKDRSAFSKLFNQQTGMPPISYRRQFMRQ